MSDEHLYDKILAMTKRYLSTSPAGKRLEAEEVANEAYIIVKTGKGGFKEDGNVYFAIQKACDPRKRDNVHVRHEGVHLAYHVEGFFDSIQDTELPEYLVDLQDAIDSLPTEQRDAIESHLRGDKSKRRDLKLGQKAMRDIYDS